MARLQASGTEHQSGIVTELGLDAFCFNWGVYGSLLGERDNTNFIL